MRGRFLLLALSLLLLCPLTAAANSAHGGGRPGRLHAQQWGMVAIVKCNRTASNGAICDRLLGPLNQLVMKMIVRENLSAPGITFSAIYIAVTPPPAPGAGLRPFGLICAFGLLADRQRFIRGPFDSSSTCRAGVQGHMMLARGATTPWTHRLDFWVTDETATIPGSSVGTIVNPLGGAYPLDTRFPATPGGIHQYGTKQALTILGFPVPAGQLPAGVSVLMNVSNIPLAGHS